MVSGTTFWFTLPIDGGDWKPTESRAGELMIAER
jgi:hypothetical protein